MHPKNNHVYYKWTNNKWNLTMLNSLKVARVLKLEQKYAYGRANYKYVSYWFKNVCKHKVSIDSQALCDAIFICIMIRLLWKGVTKKVRRPRLSSKFMNSMDGPKSSYGATVIIYNGLSLSNIKLLSFFIYIFLKR